MTRWAGRRPFIVLALWALAAMVPDAAAAAPYPAKPVQIYVGYPAAGASGQIARIVAPALSQAIGQPVEVVDLLGNDGIRAAAHVAKAPPDGYSLLLTTTGMVTFHQFIHKNLPYNPQQDFAAVSLIADMDNVLLVRPALPAHSISELIALAKREPKLTYARVDVASTNSLAMLLFDNLAGIDVTMSREWTTLVASLDALAEGKVDLAMHNLSAVLPLIKQGKVRALATTGRVRAGSLPDVPTIGETLADYRANAWFGIVAPRATPREVVRLLNVQISRILAQPQVAGMFRKMDADTVGGSPDDFETFIQSERTKWRRVIAAANITPQ
ncbi:MAG TPA: tripartite tricarboxylate transporter substrate-binding protein [Alphaproteobacteria bacterium]